MDLEASAGDQPDADELTATGQLRQSGAEAHFYIRRHAAGGAVPRRDGRVGDRSPAVIVAATDVSREVKQKGPRDAVAQQPAKPQARRVWSRIARLGHPDEVDAGNQTARVLRVSEMTGQGQHETAALEHR
jgi:hypothetical protein